MIAIFWTTTRKIEIVKYESEKLNEESANINL